MNYAASILSVLGVPTLLFYTFFCDISAEINLWKTIILAVIGIVTAAALGGMQLIKFAKQGIEFIKYIRQLIRENKNKTNLNNNKKGGS